MSVGRCQLGGTVERMPVLWSGRPPDESLRRLLRDEGVTLADRGAAGGQPVAEVVSTAPGAPPRRSSGDGLAWVWLAAGQPSADALATAVSEGAYDAIAA